MRAFRLSCPPTLTDVDSQIAAARTLSPNLVGLRANHAEKKIRAEGLTVRRVDLAREDGWTQELILGRVTILIRDGRVTEAFAG